MFNELDAPKEVKAESNESESGFRLINIKTEMTIVEGYDFIKEKLAELKKDIHYVGYDDRLNQTPTEESYLGKWEDERGESMFVPDDSTGQGKRAKEKLAEYGLEGIEYNDAEPDFSKCSEATVEIDSMTEDRTNTFAQEDQITLLRQTKNVLNSGTKKGKMAGQIGRLWKLENTEERVNYHGMKDVI